MKLPICVSSWFGGDGLTSGVPLYKLWYHFCLQRNGHIARPSKLIVQKTTYACVLPSSGSSKRQHALAIWQRTFACCVATRAWDSGYQDLLDLVNLPTMSTTGYSTLFTLQHCLQAMLLLQWYFHSMHITQSPCNSQPCVKPSLC